MIIDTMISVDHFELIQIFMRANELNGVIIHQTDIEVRGVSHRMLRLEVIQEESAIQLTFMGVKHAGVLNMFDDYLMKCGVDVSDISPTSYHSQVRKEREARLNEEFMATFQGTQ